MKLGKKFILIIIPLLFLLGALFHFLFDLSNENILIALIAPINESIWEHTKMILFPYIIIFTSFFFIHKKLDVNKYFFSLFISIIVGILTIPLLYYTYTEAFGIDLVLIDILLLLFSNIISTLLFTHIYNKIKDTIPWYVSVLLILNLWIFYIIFTFNPPLLPIFVDPSTGYFGI